MLNCVAVAFLHRGQRLRQLRMLHLQMLPLSMVCSLDMELLAFACSVHAGRSRTLETYVGEVVVVVVEVLHTRVSQNDEARPMQLQGTSPKPDCQLGSQETCEVWL